MRTQTIGTVLPTVSRAAMGYGIQTWSMASKPLAIVSAYRSDKCGSSNHANHGMLLHHLRNACGIACGEVDGCYKGETERAVLCELEHTEDYDAVMSYARLFGQESILYIHKNRDAALHFTDDSLAYGSQYLGRLKAVHESTAKRHDGYTRTNNGAYYVTI